MTDKPPPTVATLLEEAFALHRAGRLDEAEALYERVRAVDAVNVDALTNLGTIYLQRGRYERALETFEASLKRNRRQVNALFNAGLALQGLRRYDDAIRTYRQAVALDPRHYSAHNNLGNAMKEIGEYDAALASFAQALRFKPDHPSANWSVGAIHLLRGDFAAGLPLLEWRWKVAGIEDATRRFTQPLWLGKEPLTSKAILLHAEQGLGDTIQFCRYAKLAAEVGATVVLEVPASLVAFMRTLRHDVTVVAQGEALPPFDCHCPVMTLPLAFGTTLTTIPAAPAYLGVDEARRAGWRDTLGPKSRPRVGLVWSGRPTHLKDHGRTIPLEALRPLLAEPAEFHALQTEFRETDRVTLLHSPQIKTWAHRLTDFAETAALAAEMDVVVSVDTSVAHLAAAIGRPTWILIPYSPDFRWLLEREDSPWYPTARLFRQPKRDDWPSAIEKVVGALRALAT